MPTTKFHTTKFWQPHRVRTCCENSSVKMVGRWTTNRVVCFWRELTISFDVLPLAMSSMVPSNNIVCHPKWNVSSTRHAELGPCPCWICDERWTKQHTLDDWSYRTKRMRLQDTNISWSCGLSSLKRAKNLSVRKSHWRVVKNWRTSNPSQIRLCTRRMLEYDFFISVKNRTSNRNRNVCKQVLTIVAGQNRTSRNQ